MTYEKIRRECYEANLRIVREGLVLLTWGNVSVGDHECVLGRPDDRPHPPHPRSAAT